MISFQRVSMAFWGGQRGALEEHPSLDEVLDPLAGRLGSEVDVKGCSPASVAREFLEKEGLLAKS